MASKGKAEYVTGEVFKEVMEIQDGVLTAQHYKFS